MKKILLLLAVVMTAFSANAAETVYNGILSVELNSSGSLIRTPGAEVIMVEKDGVYKLQLKNFILEDPENTMYVGNISVPDLTVAENGSFYSNSENNIKITEGEDKTKEWMGGSLLNEVSGEINGTVKAGQLQVSIEMNVSGMTVDVNFVSMQQMAQFNGNLEVTVAGEKSTSESSVYVYLQADKKACLILKEFTLKSGDDEIAVGNIYVPDLTTGEGGAFTSTGTANILLTKGSDTTKSYFAESMKTAGGTITGTTDFASSLKVNIQMTVSDFIVNVDFNGQATGISKVNADVKAKAETNFNLAGQRVSSNARGIVICGGKKVIK